MLERLTALIAAVTSSLNIGTTQYISPTEPTQSESSVPTLSQGIKTYRVNSGGELYQVFYEDGTTEEVGTVGSENLAAYGIEINTENLNVMNPADEAQDNAEPDTEIEYTTISAEGDSVYPCQESTMMIEYTILPQHKIPSK